MALKVEGLRELEHALTQLPDAIAKRTLKTAVRAGAAVIRQEVRQRAPFRHVKRAIISRYADRSGSSIYTVSYDVGVNLRVAPDYHWWEFGIPHTWTIEAGKKKVGKKIVLTGKKFLYASEIKKFYKKPQNKITHKPLAARPFLRPGSEAAAPKSVEAMKRILAQAIIIETSKLARKMR